ncbi:hypothetical protein ACFV3F_09445 [Streptomyces sp. NPDC059717]|uniref:hypothetical protein n=1 Tax=Streptomyces sp. NPDC059717 TaxID=3346922 RepID=UPI0036B1C60F
MSNELTPEQERDAALLELAKLRVGLAAGLTPDQSKFLRAGTPEEMAADARTLLTEFGLSNSRQPSGSGSDVNSPGAAGTLEAGAAAYRRKNGLDEDGKRPTKTDGRNPFQTNGYTMETL